MSETQQPPVAILPKNSHEEVRSLAAYRGVDRIDIRVFADINGLGVFMPTRKGVSLKAEQLPDIITALQEAKHASVRCFRSGGGRNYRKETLAESWRL
jgi:hypothetical protein